eukprot:1658438-Pyramimonas_sp.AAC.1
MNSWVGTTKPCNPCKACYNNNGDALEGAEEELLFESLGGTVVQLVQHVALQQLLVAHANLRGEARGGGQGQEGRRGRVEGG